MTANHAHTPTPAAFRHALQSMTTQYFTTAIARSQFLAEYDSMIAQVEAAAEQRGAIKAFRKTQEIIAGFEHTIDEERERGDMINTGYLIQEIDTEIQDLMEGDDA